MFSKEDIARYRAFKVVMNQAKFDIQGNAVIAAASLFAWFNDLEKKIEACIEPKPIIAKEVKSPFSDVGVEPTSAKKSRRAKGESDAV